MMLNNLISDLKVMLTPLIDFGCYLYRFLSKFFMCCLAWDSLSPTSFLLWDLYHWTRDHWYFSALVVVVLSYITFKNARLK